MDDITKKIELKELELSLIYLGCPYKPELVTDTEIKSVFGDDNWIYTTKVKTHRSDLNIRVDLCVAHTLSRNDDKIVKQLGSLLLKDSDLAVCIYRKCSITGKYFKYGPYYSPTYKYINNLLQTLKYTSNIKRLNVIECVANILITISQSSECNLIRYLHTILNLFNINITDVEALLMNTLQSYLDTTFNNPLDILDILKTRDLTPIQDRIIKYDTLQSKIDTYKYAIDILHGIIQYRNDTTHVIA